MKKSVYSLVLMDDIVEAIDRMAYQQNTSRSNLINQILADKVAVVTPEMQMKNIFDTIEQLLGGYQHFQIQPQAADSMLSIRSVLRYKYNPTIRYAITLEKGNSTHIGELKVVSRTQSNDLQGSLHAFFSLWSALEKENGLLGWELDQAKRWGRQLHQEKNTAYALEEIAAAITEYVKWVDDGLRIYCTHLGNLHYAELQVYQHFISNIKTNHYFI